MCYGWPWPIGVALTLMGLVFSILMTMRYPDQGLAFLNWLYDKKNWLLIAAILICSSAVYELIKSLIC